MEPHLAWGFFLEVTMLSPEGSIHERAEIKGLWELCLVCLTNIRHRRLSRRD